MWPYVNDNAPWSIMGGPIAAQLTGTAPGTHPAGPQMPPPLPAAWRVALNGQSTGPFGPDQLAAAVAAGSLGPDTLVWAAGMPGWTAAAQVPRLAGHFPPAPPTSES